MTLEELARARPFAAPPAVPEWTLGCFSRRCITYATGTEDTTTQVIWIQSHGLTGDLRIPASRKAPAAASLADCSREELVEIVRAEGFAARTAWDGTLMSWDAFASFQPYDKWPEPGRLERVGASLIEWAPSGTYVADWRLQSGSEGLSVGLVLESETGRDGIEAPRSGALVIAGVHALRIIERRGGLPEGPLALQMAEADDPQDLARVIFDGEVSYARRDGPAFRIARAMDPFSQGAVLFAPDAFETGADEDVIIETAPPGASWLRRRWRVDTLLADQERGAATPAAPEGLAWLEREAQGLAP